MTHTSKAAGRAEVALLPGCSPVGLLHVCRSSFLENNSGELPSEDKDFFIRFFHTCWWRRGVVVITTAQLHATKPEFRFCTGSNPARGESEIRDGEDL